MILIKAWDSILPGLPKQNDLAENAQLVGWCKLHGSQGRIQQVKLFQKSTDLLKAPVLILYHIHSSQKICPLLRRWIHFRENVQWLFEARNNCWFLFLFGGRKYKSQKTLQTPKNMSDYYNQPIRTLMSCLRFPFSLPRGDDGCSVWQKMQRRGGYSVSSQWSALLKLPFISAERSAKDQSLWLLVIAQQSSCFNFLNNSTEALGIQSGKIRKQEIL